jgi:hypothetical protein
LRLNITLIVLIQQSMTRTGSFDSLNPLAHLDCNTQRGNPAENSEVIAGGAKNCFRDETAPVS